MKNSGTNAIITAFAGLLNDFKVEYQARESALEIKALSDNGDTKPTEDINGRLHAPFAGYIWDESVYGAGEYLPVETSFKQGCDAKTRFKSDVKTVKIIGETLKEMCEFGYTHCSVEAGKSWNQSGIDCCYCYVSGLTQSQVDKVLKSAEDIKAKLASDIKANKGTAPTGKIEVIGKIIHLFVDAYDNGYMQVFTNKMLVELENGATVSGAQPKSLYAVNFTVSVSLAA